MTASIASDDRYRGFSLSDGRPSATLTLGYDHSSGAYAAVSAVAADTARDGPRVLGYQIYAGYAGRIRFGPSWDVGVSHTDLAEYHSPRYRIRYTEIYAGLAGRNLSAHVYYSPNYLGEGVDTIYLDLTGTIRPAPDWRLFAHAGAMTPLSRNPGAEVNAPQI